MWSENHSLTSNFRKLFFADKSALLPKNFFSNVKLQDIWRTCLDLLQIQGYLYGLGTITYLYSLSGYKTSTTGMWNVLPIKLLRPPPPNTGILNLFCIAELPSSLRIEPYLPSMVKLAWPVLKNQRKNYCKTCKKNLNHICKECHVILLSGCYGYSFAWTSKQGDSKKILPSSLILVLRLKLTV